MLIEDVALDTLLLYALNKKIADVMPIRKGRVNPALWPSLLLRRPAAVIRGLSIRGYTLLPPIPFHRFRRKYKQSVPLAVTGDTW